MRLLALLLLAAPLSAQQTVVVPDVNVQVEPTPITIENNVQVMSDSAMVANFNANMDAFRAYLEQERECNTCGGASTTTKVAVAVLIPVLVWIAWELRGIKNNSAGIPGEPGKDGSDGVDGEDGHHDHRHKHDDESGES